MITERGIYLNIEESTYKFRYDNLTLVFSSKFYLNKFKKLYIEYIREETTKLSLNFKGIVYADIIILLKLYKLIEKRGFLVYYKNKKLEKEYYTEFKLFEN